MKCLLDATQVDKALTITVILSKVTVHETDKYYKQLGRDVNW